MGIETSLSMYGPSSVLHDLRYAIRVLRRSAARARLLMRARMGTRIVHGNRNATEIRCVMHTPSSTGIRVKVSCAVRNNDERTRLNRRTDCGNGGGLKVTAQMD